MFFSFYGYYWVLFKIGLSRLGFVFIFKKSKNSIIKLVYKVRGVYLIRVCILSDSLVFLCFKIIFILKNFLLCF